TGVVKPMSEEALRETIRLDIRVKAAAGEQIVLLAPGNYGEVYLRDHLGVPMGEAVLCSNFVADAAWMLAEEGIRRVLFTGHIGKLVKVSAGRRNTHSRYGDGRMEELANLTQPFCHGDREDLPERIRSCNTTEEATALLLEADLAGEVLEQIARRVKIQM
ncbi:MAG: cobalt-precorrin-5B (C(1))-methyltransferase, partial [Clostridiales bacterium]|nr:cobalt-precorrin-5B (C(1))-methyltransferase [Clostridiales bacterium]